jgi:hypothetical protein
MSFDFGLYDYADQTSPKEEKKAVKEVSKKPEAFDFDMYEEYISAPQEESTLSNAFRTLYQIPSGIAQAVTYPADLISMIAAGESLDPEEIEHIKMVSERAGIPFDEEKYREAVQTAQGTFPTQSNIEQAIEERTGAPLTPKTRLQKGLKFASTAGKIAPTPSTFRGLNTALPKTAIGAGLGAIKETGQELGLPEPVAELGSFLALKQLPKGSPSVSIGKQRGPGGLPERRYEKLTSETQVSANRHDIINKKIEKDFKEISDKLIQESPISETYNALEKDASFQQKVDDTFREVESLADEISGSFSSEEIKRGIAKKYQAKESKGITPTEAEKDYNKFMKGYLKEIPSKNLTARQLVDQYRKNNKSLGEIYESGKSVGFNNAKKDSLLDYNRALAEIIEEKYPNTEFSNLFKDTNKKWTEIYDSQYMNKVIDDIFKEGVNFDKGRKFFTQRSREVFTRALGKENMPHFERLMKDFMSKEKVHGLLKRAKDLGFSDFVKMGATYLVEPHIAIAKFAYGNTKRALQTLLDKPQLSIIWDEGIQAAKKGDFKTAQTKIAQVDQIVKASTEQRDQAMKKFNEKVRENSKKAQAIPIKAEKVKTPNQLSHANDTVKALENRPSVQGKRKEESR